jgi:hypothetical protein
MQHLQYVQLNFNPPFTETCACSTTSRFSIGTADSHFPDRATWIGCGFHVPSVMDSIPKEKWCTCEPKVEKKGQMYPPMGSPLSACVVL